MSHVYSLPTHVCSLKDKWTPLMFAAYFENSSAVHCKACVEALVYGKANVHARNKVRHLEDYRCSPYFCE